VQQSAIVVGALLAGGVSIALTHDSHSIGEVNTLVNQNLLSFKPSTRQVTFAAATLTAVGAYVGLVSPAISQSGYIDDTFATLATASSIVSLSGDHGLTPYKYDRSDDGRVIGLDARSGAFTVANSKNDGPTYSYPCTSGSLPTNPYPFNVSNHDKTLVVGGITKSRVPQSSDWEPTYCNSAAVIFKEARYSTVDGVRIPGAWDAVRVSSGSSNLTLKNSWISNVRDDFLENDYLYPTTVQDTLIDGSFQGLSVKPSSSSVPDASSQVVTMSGVVMRLREYLYKGKSYYGAPTKNEARSPRVRFRNSVVAVDYKGGSTWYPYWSTTWSKLTDSGNNVFLWLSDSPIPSSFPLPPSGSFSIVKGQAARDLWAKARTNWINCHPKVLRLSTDTQSNTSACAPNSWGGYNS
jgi:hypothetical protein